MKLKVIFLLCVTTAIIGCREEKSIEQQMDPKTTVCYISVADKDTAWLKIDTASNQIIGIFEMTYPNKKHRYLGEFNGVTRGDTIKGHYDFKVNKADKWNRNPVSFLKRNGKLIMGVGKINMVWGSAHFDDKTPIDYNKARFIFDEGICGK